VKVSVIKYGDKYSIDDYDAIILSPGPKSPADYPLTLNLLNTNLKIPVLGICLGMQMMLEREGAKIIKYQPPIHGKTSSLLICNHDSLFKNISDSKVARYHSLIAQDIPETFSVLAKSPEGHVMAVLHKTKKLLGVQFHPESFLTEQSELLRDNVLHWMKTC
jgi:anthranilate synthase/phosphoribosyltransferase